MVTKKTKLCTKLERSFGKGFTCKNKKGFEGSLTYKKLNRYTLTNKRKTCLDLELNDDSLSVYHLNKCPDSSGSATMAKLEKVGKEMDLDHIDLQDGQSLIFECNKNKLTILTKYVNILADGESWYNKLGYKSKTHQAEVRNNKQIGQMNAGEFVREVMNFRKKSPYKRMDYWGPLDVTVKEYFTGIKEALKKELPTKQFSKHECVKYRWLEYMMWNINSMLWSKSKSKSKIQYDGQNLSLPL